MNGPSTVLSGVFAERYAIERELGSGGTAVVYLARDLNRGHPVAIKVLRPELAQSVGEERFLKEIRLSQKLYHPHILPVLDSGSVDGQVYFVLPHMEGGTLRTRLQQEKQLPLEEALAITRSVAVALAHAHEQGLVHRDVKPENILFTSGQACLADFGIARALEKALDEPTTSTSVVRGTPPYMSPEQASGEISYDGRSDIYSLGCVVYEMLGGMPPFVGPTPQSVIAQRLMHPPRPLRVYRPVLPAAVEAAVNRALMIAPADRFQTATEFIEALEAAARTPDPAMSVDDSAAKSRRWRFVVAGVVVAAIAIAATARVMTAPSHEPGAIPEGDPRRVAVLYLDDLTPATVSPHVVDGVTEDLIDQLSSVRALHVISPNGVRQFRTSAVSVDSIGRALKVGTIVSGSVARSGNTLRINVRLIDATNGRQIHSQSLEEPWTELFALQGKLANQVAFFLRQRIGDEIALRAGRSDTRSLGAWETLQRGNAEANRGVEAGIRNDPTWAALFMRADSLFARAQELDRAWERPALRRIRVALALAIRPPLPPRAADAAAFAAMDRTARQLVWLRRGVELADSLLRRSPRSAEALALRGEARFKMLTAGASGSDSLAALSERDLRAAVQARPEDASAWSSLAQLSYTQGKFVEAANAAARAFDADAFFEVRRTVSTALSASLYAEQFADARRWCRLGLAHYRSDPRFAQCELTILGWTGRTEAESRTAWRLVGEIEAADTLGGLHQTWAYRRLMVAAVLARSPMTDSARVVLRSVQQRTLRDREAAPLGEAYVHVLLRDRDAAIASLRDYLRSAPAARAQVGVHPWFKELRDDPRFRALVQSRL